MQEPGAWRQGCPGSRGRGRSHTHLATSFRMLGWHRFWSISQSPGTAAGNAGSLLKFFWTSQIAQLCSYRAPSENRSTQAFSEPKLGPLAESKAASGQVLGGVLHEYQRPPPGGRGGDKSTRELQPRTLHWPPHPQGQVGLRMGQCWGRTVTLREGTAKTGI